MQTKVRMNYTKLQERAVLLSYLYVADDKVSSDMPSLQEVHSHVLRHFRQEYAMDVTNNEFYNRDHDPEVNRMYEYFLEKLKAGEFDTYAPTLSDTRFILLDLRFTHYDETDYVLFHEAQHIIW